MLSKLVFFQVFAITSIAVAVSNGDGPNANIKRHIASYDEHLLAARAPPVLPVAEFTSSLVAKTTRSIAKSNLLELLLHGTAGHGEDRRFIGTVGHAGADYITNLTVGGQHFLAIIDTGSSDTWIVQNGFQCTDPLQNPVPQSTCAFGSSGFSSNLSSTYTKIPDVNFNITYGSGGFVAGPFGRETITVAGLTVKNQTFPTPNVASWPGDGVSSGLIGLAYPAITSMFKGSDPTVVTPTDQIIYDPFFISAIKQGAVKHPFFSISLNRPTTISVPDIPFTPNRGLISFGGIVPVPVTKNSVTLPIQGFSVSAPGQIPIPTNGPNPVYFWHSVDVQGYEFPGSDKLGSTASNKTILDTGTTLNVLPGDVATAFNAAFSPPAVFNSTFGLYLVDCNATAPTFSVFLGGKKFDIDPKDQIIPIATDPTDGSLVCISGTTSRGDTKGDDPANLFLLGDVFLHNVVATFNVEAKQVTVSQRTHY